MLPFFETKHIDISCNINLNKNFPPHLHNEFEFVLCLDGEINVTCDEHVQLLKSNDFFLALPNTVHSYSTPKESKIILCIFKYDFLPMFKFLYAKEIKYPFIKGNKDISIYCNRLFKEFNEEKNTAIITGYLHLILGNALKQLEISDKNLLIDKDVLPKILQFVEQNYRNDISLAEVSRQFGYNPSYISKLFSAKIGCTLSRYINAFRINYAKHLLSNTESSITTIASECGFSSLRTFNRVFIKFEKTTPREFRTNFVIV